MRIIAALVALLLVSTAAFAQGLKQHFDERTGTVAMVPSEWQPSSRDPDWEGVRFFSDDKESWVAVWGKSSEGHSSRSYYKLVADTAGDRVTYSRRGRNWFVVSGYKGDRIFYVKAIRRCGRESWHHIALEYPAERKRAYDRMVSAVSRSLSAECD